MNQFFPAIPENADGQTRMLWKQTWDRLNYLLTELERVKSQPSSAISAVRQQVGELSVAMQAVQDSLTQNSTFVSFGNATPIEGFDSATWPGSTSINTLGVVTTGSWNASVIQPAFGGTGLSMGSGTTGLPYITNGVWNVISYGDLADNLRVFTSTQNGLVPAPGTGTTRFLRSDGSWATVDPGVTIGDKVDIDVVTQTNWQIKAGVVTTVELGGDISLQAKALLVDQTAAAQRATLGLGALATLSSVNLTTQVTNILPVANGGTGSSTAAGALANLGGYPSTNPLGFTSNTGTVTRVRGTGSVNGITLSGDFSVDGFLTLGGTLGNVDLTSQVTGILPVANGGTGLSSPGAAGNVLTSQGGVWVSAAPTGGGGTSLNQVITSSTSSLTAVANTRYIWNISGLNSGTGNLTVTLPSGAAGDIVEIQLSTGNATNELIIASPSGGVINGNAGEWSRIFIQGEFVQLICTQANSWFVSIDGRIPCQGYGYFRPLVEANKRIISLTYNGTTGYEFTTVGNHGLQTGTHIHFEAPEGEPTVVPIGQTGYWGQVGITSIGLVAIKTGNTTFRIAQNYQDAFSSPSIPYRYNAATTPNVAYAGPLVTTGNVYVIPTVVYAHNLYRKFPLNQTTVNIGNLITTDQSGRILIRRTGNYVVSVNNQFSYSYSTGTTSYSVQASVSTKVNVDFPCTFTANSTNISVPYSNFEPNDIINFGTDGKLPSTSTTSSVTPFPGGSSTTVSDFDMRTSYFVRTVSNPGTINTTITVSKSRPDSPLPAAMIPLDVGTGNHYVAKSDSGAAWPFAAFANVITTGRGFAPASGFAPLAGGSVLYVRPRIVQAGTITSLDHRIIDPYISIVEQL